MKKLVALFAFVMMMALAGAALASDAKPLGTAYIAEQNVSDVTVNVSEMPSSVRIAAHSPHAPIALPDEQKKTLTFKRGNGYKEGRYVYTLNDADTGTAVGDYTVWVLNVERGITIGDVNAETGDVNKEVEIVLNKNFTLVNEDPVHPAAWEFPRGALQISNIEYIEAGSQYKISSTPSFSSGTALITVNGVLKYNGEFIEGAKDSGTLGSFWFVVSDLEVDKASETWSNFGVLKTVSFKVTGLKSAKIDKIELDKKTVDPANYTTADTDGGANCLITLKNDYLKTLSAGAHTFTVTTTAPDVKNVFFVVKVLTDADPMGDAKMSIVPNDVAIGDPITASIDIVPMQNITAVGLDGQDVTAFATYVSRRNSDGALLGTDVHLPSMLTVALTAGSEHTVVVSHDSTSLSAKFTAVADSRREVPGVTISPDAELKSQAPASVDFGGVQHPATLFDVEYALLNYDVPMKPEVTTQYFGADGKLTDVAARAIIATDEKLITLPTVKTTVTPGKIAPVTFIVTGYQLVSGDHSINWQDAHVYKAYAKGSDMASVRLEPARTMAEIRNGTFQIFDHTGKQLVKDPISGKNDGTLSSYRLVVYVEDNKAYDLDMQSGAVLDPVVVASSTQQASTSSSGGSCSTGFGLAAAAAALIALRKRG